MPSKDYYNILGVSKDASKEEIKKAYKNLAKKHHPDLNKEDGSADKFKEINEAASVLGDDQKRQQYDQFGSAEPGMNFNNADFSNSNFDFGDIFDNLFGGRGFSPFGGGRRRERSRRGADLRFDMDVELEDATFGKTKTTIIPRLETCKKCEGTGAKTKKDLVDCETCDGKGMITHARRTPIGIFQTTAACRNCAGTGKMIKNPCRECDGQGRIHNDKRLDIKIPAGIEEGTRLRIADEGEAGELGGPNGDLYVVMHIKPHKIFEREDNDIYMDLPITFIQAALGTEIEVPTLKDKTKIKIAPGTQPGTIMRLAGKGIPSLRGYGTGSQMIKIDVEVPKKLTKKQKELLEEFDGSFKKKKKGFFGF
jgi:molecular chaperone DnaJ